MARRPSYNPEAAAVRINLSGFDDFADTLIDRLSEGVESAAENLRREIVSNLPKDTGIMAANVRLERLGKLTYQIVVPWPWRLFEYGFVHWKNGKFYHNPIVARTTLAMEETIREQILSAV